MPTPKPAILHIGAGKAGSSALQTALTETPSWIASDGASYEYVAINHLTDIIHGTSLTKHGAGSPYGYAASVSANIIASSSRLCTYKISSDIEKITNQADRVILSNEGWIYESAIFSRADIIRFLNISPLVVIYVRPPVEWLNSAWWQWGVWTGQPLSNWLSDNLHRAEWAQWIEAWQSLDGVDSVSVRLLPKDIVSDFYSHLNTGIKHTISANRSLPASLIKFLVKHRQFRSDVHKSSANEFILSRNLRNLAGPTPWAFTRDQIEYIIKHTSSSNHRMMNYVDNESMSIMEQDGKWWNPAQYEDKIDVKKDNQHLAYEELESIAVSAIASVISLDAELRALGKKKQ